MHEILDQIGRLRLVPMVVIDNAEHAPAFGAALVSAGLPIAEITFRTDAAAAAIRALGERGDMLVGAGTILTTEQADRAIDAGASFIVAPGTNPKVVEHCQRHNVPIIPGVATPTDIELALSLGESLGVDLPFGELGLTSLASALRVPHDQ